MLVKWRNLTKDLKGTTKRELGSKKIYKSHSQSKKQLKQKE